MASMLFISSPYSLSLWFSNSAYIYLSVSFIQMLKALAPVAVYSISVLFKKESFKNETMTNMLSISFNVAIATCVRPNSTFGGVFLQLMVFAFEATRLVFNSKGILLNPIISLYYIAPYYLVFFSVPWLIMEHLSLKDDSSFHLDFVILGTDSFNAFAFNLVVFLLSGKTSALTMNIAEVVKY